MRAFLFILVFCIAQHAAFGAAKDSLFAQLSHAVKNKRAYTQEKDKRISVYKKLLAGENSPEEQYKINESLYKEYRKFKIDSAIYYVSQNTELAAQLQNKDLRMASQIQLANLYSSSGKYRESEAILKSIDSKKLAKPIQVLYYEFYSQFFEHYATNNYSKFYIEQIEVYRDSLLHVLDPNSIKYKINLAQQNIYKNRLDVAKKDLLYLMRTSKAKDENYAMFVYLLGDISGLQKRWDDQRMYYSSAAITDIENAIKDNAAIQNLAVIYYDLGNIDRAYSCAQSAIEDAIFCNVKFRTLRMSELYSIINTAYLDKEAKNKSELKNYLILISVLTVFLVLAIVYVYRQMKKVSRVKEELSKTSQKLAELNKEILSANENLKDTNGQLYESNRIKEEYIAYFFDICSAYINKMEDYRKMLNRKALNKQHDELFKLLKSTDIVDNELEELYKSFDTIFISLYPSFVKEFNALLLPEEQVTPKANEILNTELRIFALIRLGITDSVKIAAFLRYSLSTIYNYRTKARNKAAVSREEFEVMVSKIGVIQAKQ